MWNEIAVDWFSVAMWFDTFSSLSTRIQTRSLVCPLSLAHTTWFEVLDFCNAEGELVGHGVEDHEVHDSNGV